MKRIPLSSRKYPGLYAIVDDTDFELVSKYSWSPSKDGYNFYAKGRVNGKNVHMHALILKVIGHGGKIRTDHVNRNTLDNRRRNLRRVSCSINSFNRRMNRNNTSGIRGVSPSGRGWVATIRDGRRQVYLGYFKDKEKAARAYEKGVLKFR